MNKEQKQQEDMGTYSSQLLKDGPMAKRHVTDILCCLMFLAFIGISLCIVGYGFAKGNPKSLAIPQDPDHRGCGKHPDLIDYPYIYFATPYPTTLWRTVCVKECPKTGDQELKCAPNSQVKNCKGTLISKQTEAPKFLNLNQMQSSKMILLTDAEFTSKVSTKLLTLSPKDSYIYDSKPYLHVVCIPTAQTLFEQVKKVISIESIEKVTKDIKNSWEVILISSVLALVTCILFIAGMRYAAGCIIYSIIILYNVVFIVLGVFFFNKAREMTELEQQNTSKVIYYTVAGVCWAVTLISIILLLIFRNRIKLAVAIMKTASLYVGDNIGILFFPLLSFFIIILFIAYWIIAAIFLYSIGEPSIKPKQLPFGQVHHSSFIRNLGIFHIVALFWVIAFIVSSVDFVIACSCSIWYYSYKTKDKTPIKTAIHWLFRYHIGSIAFASAVLSIVWMIQVIFEYMAQQLEKSGATQNACVKCLIWFGRCCLGCFERFIRFINKGAFTQISMTGNNFCTACKDCFTLIIRNPIRFGLVSGLGELFTFIGKIFVLAITVLCGYLLLTKIEFFHSQVASIVAPLILIGIISYMIGSIFISIYGQAAETLLMVFVIDEEVQQTHFNNQKAEHAPGPLQEFFDTHAKKEPAKQ